MSTIAVKVARFPGQTKEISITPGTTVGQAFSLAEMSIDSSDNLTVNGINASVNQVMNAGDRAIAAQGAKGNA